MRHIWRDSITNHANQVRKGEKNIATQVNTVYIPTLKIGKLTIAHPVLLAPLAGFSDSAYRRTCRKAGAGMVFTEMISAEGLLRGGQKTWDLTRFKPEERPIGVQLFSHDPETFYQAAEKLQEIQPDVIDLNFGCPSKKVTRRKAGASFMEDPERIREAVRRVVQATEIPVTVKLRSGPSAERMTAVEAACMAEEEGAAAITIHGRTTAQMFRGEADWTVIKDVKKHVSIPVIGNGDIVQPNDVWRMFEETGCDGVMVGRGAIGNPWIFSACRAELLQESWNPVIPQTVWDIVEYHYLQAIEDKGEARGVREMRKHLGWYSKGMPGAAQFRAEIFRIDNAHIVLKTAQAFFLNNAHSFRFPIYHDQKQIDGNSTTATRINPNTAALG